MGARLIDNDLREQAGLQPVKTRADKKYGNGGPQRDYSLLEGVRKLIRVMDEQDAVNRYTHIACPFGTDSQEIERIIYYKGQLALFYVPELEKWYTLPFTLATDEDNAIDIYGRKNGIRPVRFGDAKKEEEFIPGLVLEPVYDVPTPEQLVEWVKDGSFYKKCVILSDYTPQISQTILSRQALNDPLIGLMSEIVPFMRTSMINACGPTGLRIPVNGDQSEVYAANRMRVDAALTGDAWVPITGNMEFQELSTQTKSDSTLFLQTLQALDNLRLSTHGLDQGGLFQKQSQMLQAEQRMNSVNSGLIIQDGLKRREKFWDIANGLWGLGSAVMISETLTNSDVDGNGVIADDNIEQNEVRPAANTNEGGEEE